jgi:hypothetical protein
MSHIKLTPERTLVTPRELYAIDMNPQFVGQSGANDEGEYSMIWSINGKEYQTNNTL